VNQLLQIEFKTYVRTIGCFPEKATREDFHLCLKGLEYSEKVRERDFLLKGCTA